MSLKKPTFDLRVKDLMSKNMIWLPMEDRIADVATEMANKDISAVLFKAGDEFIGILTDRDIIKIVAQGLNLKDVKAKEVMKSPLISITEDASVQEAAETMRDHKIRRLVVKNKNQIVGIISESDIIRIEPELHFLIRERSRLGLSQVKPLEISGPILDGFCEDCKNFSEDLRNQNGKWLCKECRGN